MSLSPCQLERPQQEPCAAGHAGTGGGARDASVHSWPACLRITFPASLSGSDTCGPLGIPAPEATASGLATPREDEAAGEGDTRLMAGDLHSPALLTVTAQPASNDQAGNDPSVSRFRSIPPSLVFLQPPSGIHFLQVPGPLEVAHTLGSSPSCLFSAFLQDGSSLNTHIIKPAYNQETSTVLADLALGIHTAAWARAPHPSKQSLWHDVQNLWKDLKTKLSEQCRHPAQGDGPEEQGPRDQRADPVWARPHPPRSLCRQPGTAPSHPTFHAPLLGLTCSLLPFPYTLSVPHAS